MALRDIVWKAFELFSNPPSFQVLENPVFSSKLNSLVHLISILQPGDIGLTLEKLDQLRHRGRAPVWYMSIVDAEDDHMIPSSSSSDDSDEEEPTSQTRNVYQPAQDPAVVMTVAGFAMKPGARLPLHDHPKMFGILKVLHGCLTVQSYSSVKCLDTTQGHFMPRLLAEKHEVMQMTADSDPVLIHRNSQDIHQIVNNTEKMGFFMDVLSPPYDFRLPEDSDTVHAHRYITYYREVGSAFLDVAGHEPSTGEKNYVILEEIQCPSDYKTEHTSYDGPSLSRVNSPTKLN